MGYTNQNNKYGVFNNQLYIWHDIFRYCNGIKTLFHRMVSFLMDEDETEYDDPNEPLVEGSDEEFECLEERVVGRFRLNTNHYNN